MIPEHLKKYVRNQITVDEDALIKLLSDKDKEIERLKGLIEYVYKQFSFLDEEAFKKFKTENNL